MAVTRLLGVLSFLLIGSFVYCLPAPEAKSWGCNRLSAKFPKLVALPDSTEYKNSTLENWSQTCVQFPFCVFEPETSEQVASAVQILKDSKTKFAVRGGGHMPVRGAASITDGVLISLSSLNETTLAENNAIARLGPGLRWGPVYEWISKFGLAIVGGRYYPVGVPGLLLGGGVSYFGSRFGWSANTVQNFQVVLANGSIVNANATSNPDLFWALKGGSSNFGIVTRFDIKTFPLDTIYGGTSLYDPKDIDKFLNAVASFSVEGGGSSDIDTAVNPTCYYDATAGTFQLFTLSNRVGSEIAPKSLSNFTSIPPTSSNVSLRKGLSNFSNETANPLSSDRSDRQSFHVTFLKAGLDSVKLSNETFFRTIASMPELKKVPGLFLAQTHQTVTTAWMKAARASGGDPMDLDPSSGNLIGYLLGTTWDNATDDAVVSKFYTKVISEIEAKAKARGLHHPFKYLNDAAIEQKVFENYGTGKSLPKLRAIRKKYDPSGVFQTLAPGGFKLGF